MLEKKRMEIKFRMTNLSRQYKHYKKTVNRTKFETEVASQVYFRYFMLSAIKITNSFNVYFVVEGYLVA